jgi:iron complex outermembrane receptor protein
VSFLDRAFAAEGEEALAPPVDQRGAAAYIYEELTWPHATVQFGGRFDYASFRPEGGLPSRDFNQGSGSLGLLVRPIRDNDNVVIAASLARAARNPALDELYYFGAHAGNAAFEVGNPLLGTEYALGFDLSLRMRHDRLHGELTVFRNSVSNFIFRRPLTEDEFVARIPEFEATFGKDDVVFSDELTPIEFTAADSVLYGVEAQVEATLGRGVTAELTYDWVHGELAETGQALPRMPPYRIMPGVRWQRNALQAGGSVMFVAAQNRVYAPETPTEGYGLLRLFASYSLAQGPILHTLTARLDNGTNERYRNHLNYLKDELPEMGRSLRVIYTVGF